MPTAEQLADKLADSGLISVAELQQFCEQLPTDDASDSADQLSRRLLDSKVLTQYQLDAVRSDTPQPLVVGDYVVLEKVGAGGMGVVYKAQHRRMKRNVALKMLPPEFGKDESSLRRFEREVEVAAKLNHRNIVAALDAREHEGNHFLIMEFVAGRSLQSVVQQEGALPVDVAVGYILQAAEGLEHAHRLGVIHRDIKPANMMVGSDGVIKILDMGLARLELPVADGFAQTQTDLTSVGVVMGTLDYVSPEQAVDSRKVDHRTDIYSLGCTLYYLLVGQPVYRGETPMEILIAHRERPIPSICQQRTDAPLELDRIFARMVAKRTEDRFQSMSEVIAALREVVGGRSRVAASEPEPEWDEPILIASMASAQSPLSAPPSRHPDSSAMTGTGFSAVARSFSRAFTNTLSQWVSGATRPTRLSIDPVSSTAPAKLIPRWKFWTLIMVGRLTGMVLGIVAGVGIGNLIGGIAVAIAIVIYLVLGIKWGAGYAALLAYQLGVTRIRPEAVAGQLFHPGLAKSHAIAAFMGAAIGSFTVGSVAGAFLGITCLAAKERTIS